jgi:hypothetical protein
MNKKKHLERVSSLGCYVCRQEGHDVGAASVHHLLKSGKKRGDLFTIPLCFEHHQSGHNCESFVSRHPHRVAWEKRYGPEIAMWEATMAKLKELYPDDYKDDGQDSSL